MRPSKKSIRNRRTMPLSTCRAIYRPLIPHSCAWCCSRYRMQRWILRRWCVKISEEAERDNPNIVKPAIAFQDGSTIGRALYFSRARIPSGDGPHYHHIGIYAYRRAALASFVSLSPGRLEQCEKLEQLRALEAGMRIDAACVDIVPLGVDTPADLERARLLLGSS